jgi:hypothetical protein
MANELAPIPAFRGRGRVNELVAELRRQQDTRSDFTISTSDLSVRFDETGSALLVPGPSARDWLPRDGAPILDQALVQICERANPEVPVRFMRRAIEAAPTRFAEFLTGLLHDANSRRFVRVLDGRVRAFLSDRFRCYEALDVVGAVLAGASQNPSCRILEASITDSHVRIKLVNPDVFDFVVANKGSHAWASPGMRANPKWTATTGFRFDDLPMQGGESTVWPTATFSTSDTGHGGYNGDIGLLQAICANLATVEKRLAVVHLGARLAEGIYEHDTVQAEAKAISLKARDLISTAFDQAKFSALIERVRKSDAVAVDAPVSAAKNVIALGMGVGELDLDALVRAFGRERPTLYGLGQAVARLAQDTDDASVAAEREALAGQILTGRHRAELLAVAGA